MLTCHDPFYPVFRLFSRACPSPVPFDPSLSPPLFPPLNIPSKMLIPDTKSCVCTQLPPICQMTQAEPLPWTHLDGSYPAHGVTAPWDTQEGPGQGTLLAPMGLMWFPHTQPWASLLLLQVFFITHPNQLLGRPSRWWKPATAMFILARPQGILCLISLLSGSRQAGTWRLRPLQGAGNILCMPVIRRCLS